MLDFHHWPESTELLPYLKRSWKDFSEVGATPFEIIEEAGSLKLKRYFEPTQSGKSQLQNNPILIIPSFINRSFVLDLLPEKSFIRYLLNSGHDVYLIDWDAPKSHEQHLSVEALFTVHLRFLIEVAFSQSKLKKMHLVGHCIGGTVSVILAALFPQYFLSLSLLTSPVNFRSDSKLYQWVTHPDFDSPAYSQAYGNVPWAIMQSAFLCLKPTQIFARTTSFLQKFNDRKFLRNFLALEAWINDNVNMRGKLLEFIIEDLYKNNKLLLGNFVIDGKPVRVDQLRLPIFVLKSDADHIVPETSHLIKEMVPFVNDYYRLESQGGHIGVLIGGRAQKVVWPQIAKWLHQCEGGQRGTSYF